jgi:hypothetical protein
MPKPLPFSAPESVRHPAVQSPEALAFCATYEAMCCIPEHTKADEFTLRMITNGVLDQAQTIRLLELANF